MLAWLKHKIRDYFGFSKAEAHGVLILVSLIILFLALPPVLQWHYSHNYTAKHDADIALLDSTLALLEKQKISQQTLPKQSYQPSKPISPGRRDKTKARISKNLQAFDINTTDTSQLQQLPGIGPVLSTRIIKYRDKLGGFIQKTQYKEIYGLEEAGLESLYKHTYILPDFQPKQLNINTTDFKTLVAHPYLSYEQVQSIMRYRAKHGKLSTPKELLTLGILESSTFEKVAPYLTVHE